MIKTLKFIAEQYGNDILKDGTKLIAYYSDLEPHQKTERQKLEYLVKCNGHIILINALNASTDEQARAIKNLITTMQSQLLISAETAYDICFHFWEGIGGPSLETTQFIASGHTDKESDTASHYYEPTTNHYSPNNIIQKIGINKLILVCGALIAIIILVCVIVFSPKTPDKGPQALSSSQTQIQTHPQNQTQTNPINQQENNQIIKIYEQAQRYKESKDYASAITYIKSNLDIVNNNKDVMSILDACQKTYRQNVISSALSAYQSSGYEAAIAEIDEGLTILPDDATLLSERTSYAECQPISLFSLTPYTYSETKPAHYKNMKDTLGNSYANAWMGFGKESDGGSSVTYDIGQRYNILTGTIIVREDDKGEPDAAGIRIFGDGVLLYENMQITSDTKPIQLQLDVTNVTDLKIELNCGGGNWMSGYHVYAVICDIELEKKL